MRLSGAARRPSVPKRPSAAKRTTSSARTPRGQNKAKILAALEGRGPMTASDVAKVTGIPVATVSTTLTKMAKTGELVKAERGYTLPQ
jgi:predicted ArsR family transcriptional regulator